MDISIFEVIGPIMMGPSSSSTAGMARLGSVAHQFIDEEIKSIDLKFCAQKAEDYYTCMSHLGLIGGVLGINERDVRLRKAVELAAEKGIELSISVFDEPFTLSHNTVKIIAGLASGKTFELTGISVGGGSIKLLDIDGFAVDPNQTAPHLFVWSDKDVDGVIAARIPGTDIQKSTKDDKYLYCCELDKKAKESVSGIFEDVPEITKTLFVKPFIPFGVVPHKPLFTTYDELIALSEATGKNAAQLALDYEVNRSGRTAEEIRRDMKEQLDVMRESMEIGLNGTEPFCSFAPKSTGKKLLEAYNAGRTLGGSVLPKAIAIGLAILEVGSNMGLIVGTPTGGSAGVVPGPLFALQEEHGFSDEELVDALLVCSAMGVVIYYHNATFSGGAGGCQSEVGVASGLAAAAIAFLGGCDTKFVCHACALAIKNILGLICDPITGVPEVPCVKRNGIGVANAFTAADMAIAGIESFIPPDEVIDSLVEVQRLMPKELKSGLCGSACTPTGCKAAGMAKEILKDILLPRKE